MKIQSLPGIVILCFVLSGNSFADEEGMTIHRDLQFATVDQHSLHLDLYVPRDVHKPPLVVWIHGGGWRAGSKAKPPLRLPLTQNGYAVASISYRFTDTAIFPAQIHDCKAAIRWLRANAQQYGYNADWIAVAGSSAGGHLALLLGTSAGVRELEGTVGGNLDHSSSVAAVVDYFGPSDFVLRGETQPDRAYSEESGSFALLGGLVHGKVSKSLERSASPVSYVDREDPPLLVFHGTDDEVVLIDQSERIASVYATNQLEAKLIRIEGSGHGGAKFFRGENFETLLTFLDKHCPNKGERRANSGTQTPDN